jgi:hypothetical protein
VLNCLNLSFSDSLTTNLSSSNVHVVRMVDIGWKNLFSIRALNKEKYDEIIAIKPSTMSYEKKKNKVLKQVEITKKSNIMLIEVPYSEHSSFTELREFVQLFKPKNIVPTVYKTEKQKEEILRYLNENYEFENTKITLEIPKEYIEDCKRISSKNGQLVSSLSAEKKAMIQEEVDSLEEFDIEVFDSLENEIQEVLQNREKSTKTKVVKNTVSKKRKRKIEKQSTKKVKHEETKKQITIFSFWKNKPEK